MRIILTLVIVGILLSSSCEKITDKIIDKLSPEFTTDIDGTTWETKAVLALKSDSGFNITASEDTTMFMLFIKEFKNGTFDIKNGEAAATYTIGEQANIHVSLSGEIEVKEAEDHGGNFDINFHFMAVNLLGDTVYITNGKGRNIINPL